MATRCSKCGGWRGLRWYHWQGTPACTCSEKEQTVKKRKQRKPVPIIHLLEAVNVGTSTIASIDGYSDEGQGVTGFAVPKQGRWNKRELKYQLMIRGIKPLYLKEHRDRIVVILPAEHKPSAKAMLNIGEPEIEGTPDEVMRARGSQKGGRRS